MKITYSSNNSGGSWWLTDKDWKALDKAGWHVIWGGTYFCHPEHLYSWDVARDSYPCDRSEGCPGHRAYESFTAAKKGKRYLGALAKEASKDFPTPGDAMREFESLTGQSVSDEGCGCCGAPHSFNWDEGGYDYASGDQCVTHLYPGTPGSLREAAELLTVAASAKAKTVADTTEVSE